MIRLNFNGYIIDDLSITLFAHYIKPMTEIFKQVVYSMLALFYLTHRF